MTMTDSTTPLSGAICVTQIQLSLEAEDNSLSLLIRFYPRHAPQEELTCLFRGVRDLRFLGNPTILGGVVILKIEDVSSSGWERIRYRVGDEEEELVSFYCDEMALGSS